MRLTKRDNEILDLLVHRTRLLSVRQVADHFFPGQRFSIRNAQSRLKELANGGYVTLQETLARTPCEIVAPVLTFTPGDSTPDFGPLAWQFQQRWIKAEIVPIEVAYATKKTKRERDGSVGGRLPRASELSHDVILAEVCLLYLSKHPHLAANWVPEDQLREELRGEATRGAIPDAIIRSRPDAPPELSIEVAGAYRREKLSLWHQSNSQRPYEIW